MITILVETFLWVAYLVLACTALALSVSSANTYTKTVLGVSFLVYASIYAFRAIIRPDAKKILVITDYVSAAIFLALGITTLVLSTSIPFVASVSIVFFGTLALRRIPRLVLYHRIRNIVFNILVWLALAFFTLGDLGVNDWSICCLVAMFISIISVVGLAFSRIRLGLLLKIIRKTFVGEILFGLITLIAVFSFVFYMLENNIFPAYGDALWYSFAVVTTIGFGDYAPVTLVGRILSVILGMYGIIVVAALTSVIVNFYTESSKSDEKGSLQTEEQVLDAFVGEKGEAESKEESPENESDEEDKPESQE